MKRASLKSSVQISSSRCSHITSNGSRCRMLAASESRFCRSHSQFSRRDATTLTAELSQVAGSLASPEDVQRVLAKIFLALLEDRVSTRKAAVLGYLGQMLLRSQREVLVRKDSVEEDRVKQDIQAFYNDPSPSAIKTRTLDRNVALAEDALKVAKEAQAADQAAKEESSTTKAALPQPSPQPQPSTPAAPSSAPQKTLQSRHDAGQSSSAKPESVPKAPQFDFNHFYPHDPTLKPGLQDPNKTLPPPDAQELRWRELNRRFAPRRR
jgi:hypothetical protein